VSALKVGSFKGVPSCPSTPFKQNVVRNFWTRSTDHSTQSRQRRRNNSRHITPSDACRAGVAMATQEETPARGARWAWPELVVPAGAPLTGRRRLGETASDADQYFAWIYWRDDDSARLWQERFVAPVWQKRQQPQGCRTFDVRLASRGRQLKCHLRR